MSPRGRHERRRPPRPFRARRRRRRRAGARRRRRSTALSLRDARAEVAVLGEQDAALQAREQRLTPRPGRDAAATPFFEARTVTQAGAALQTRLEAAVAAAHGRLISSKVEVAPRERRTPPRPLGGTDHRRARHAGAAVRSGDAGAPICSSTSLEARAGETAANAGGAMRVALTVSGQWSGTP